MSSTKKASFILALAIMLLLIISCSTVDVYHVQGPGNGIGHGPPAHARAYGYHRKQIAGVELIFDSGLGLYVVDGRPNHYYYDGYFYRLQGTVWEMSLQPDEGWTCVSIHSLPRGLQAKQTKGNGKHNKVF